MNIYTYDEIKIGQKVEFKKNITQKDMSLFLEITGDNNPLHNDFEFAKTTKFQKNVVFGLLVQSYLSTLAGMYLPGKYSLILAVDSKFKNPAFINDEVKISGEVINKIDIAKMIVLKTQIKNQENKILVEGEMKVQVIK